MQELEFLFSVIISKYKKNQIFTLLNLQFSRRFQMFENKLFALILAISDTSFF